MSTLFTIYFYVSLVIGFIISTILLLLLLLMAVSIIADLTGFEKVRDYIDSTVEYFVDSIIAIIVRWAMKRTQYLYGVPASYFKEMTTVEASTEKIRIAKIEIEKLQESHFMVRNDFKINELLDAIKHHEYLLTEDWFVR